MIVTLDIGSLSAANYCIIWQSCLVPIVSIVGIVAILVIVAVVTVAAVVTITTITAIALRKYKAPPSHG